MGYEELKTFAVVALAIVGALISVMTLVEKIRAWRKPADVRNATVDDRLDGHDVMLATDKKRLDSSDLAMKELLLCVALLIDHSIYGNNTDAHKKSRERLNKFLIER